jgi:hypothetical protein
MIYVFDDDEEMGACCGCPVSSAGLVTFSLEGNLRSNFTAGIGYGPIAIVAAAQNAGLLDLNSASSNGHACVFNQSKACNFGCDPTNLPGYTVTSSINLLGSITHTRTVESNPPGNPIVGLTEVPISNIGNDPDTLKYLEAQCGEMVGNGSGTGICTCP